MLVRNIKNNIRNGTWFSRILSQKYKKGIYNFGVIKINR